MITDHKINATFHPDKKTIAFLDNWIRSIQINPDSWKANYFYLTYINAFRRAPRETWLMTALEVFSHIRQHYSVQGLIPFIHIPLREDLSESSPLTLADIATKLSDYSPPSFHCASKDYYEQYYLKRLKAIQLITPEPDKGQHYFTDDFFDPKEQEYYYSLYLFADWQ